MGGMQAGDAPACVFALGGRVWPCFACALRRGRQQILATARDLAPQRLAVAGTATRGNRGRAASRLNADYLSRFKLLAP